LDPNGFGGAIDGMGYARAADDYYDEDDLLPPWVISLSSDGSWGIHLLYNTQDGRLSRLLPYTCLF